MTGLPSLNYYEFMKIVFKTTVTNCKFDNSKLIIEIISMMGKVRLLDSPVVLKLFQLKKKRKL